MTKTSQTLPKILPGTVHEQWVRCGKRGCRCQKGKLHGPYYAHFYRAGGRLRKRYLKQADVEQVRAQCQQRREDRLELDKSTRLATSLATTVRRIEESCPQQAPKT